MLKVSLTGFVLVIALAGSAAPTPVMTGRVSVIDGDTIEMHGQRIRLFAMDAPEGGQSCEDAEGRRWRCGQAAASALDQMTRGQTVSCAPRDRDRWGRVVAVCHVGALDLGASMVRNGLAVAFRRYGRDYVTHEEQARAERRGMWAGRFTSPQDWRRQR